MTEARSSSCTRLSPAFTAEPEISHPEFYRCQQLVSTSALKSLHVHLGGYGLTGGAGSRCYA
jgi:hypothetical protein